MESGNDRRIAETDSQPRHRRCAGARSASNCTSHPVSTCCGGALCRSRRDGSHPSRVRRTGSGAETPAVCLATAASHCAMKRVFPCRGCAASPKAIAGFAPGSDSDESPYSPTPRFTTCASPNGRGKTSPGCRFRRDPIAPGSFPAGRCRGPIYWAVRFSTEIHHRARRDHGEETF